MDINRNNVIIIIIITIVLIIDVFQIVIKGCADIGQPNHRTCLELWEVQHGGKWLFYVCPSICCFFFFYFWISSCIAMFWSASFALSSVCLICLFVHCNKFLHCNVQLFTEINSYIAMFWSSYFVLFLFTAKSSYILQWPLQ